MRRIIFVLFLTFSSLFSQDPNWNSFLTFPFNPPPHISDWEENPNMGTLTISYTGINPVEYYFEVIITVDKYGEAIQGRTAPREYFGPMTEMLTFRDFSNWESSTYNKELERIIIQTGKLPESDYSICVNAYSLGGKLLTEACSNFEIIFPDPPQLILPEDGGSINLAQPTFIWNPITAPAISFTNNDASVYYQLKIVEMLKGQTAYRAIAANVPIVETKIPLQNMYIYRLDDYPLEKNHSYAWQVQATNDDGAPLSANDGYSEIWQFTYGNPAGKINIDTLQLIKDYAYLIDLEQLQIIESGGAVELNGSCRMLIKGNGVPNKFVDVYAQNLMLQKDSYENPIFLGGSVIGSIVDNILSNSVVGDYFRPTDIEFFPPNLRIGGNFYLGKDVDIPLNGKLDYSGGKLSGNLSITGNQASPVFSLGDELFKVNVTSLSISYPSIETSIIGELSLFSSASTCNISKINIDKKGKISANIACNVEQEIALLKGSTMFNLKVNKVEGSISGNLLSKSVNYNVLLNGGMLFKMDSQNSVGADVSFRLKPNDFKIVSFTPSANLKTIALDLGWLKWKFDNLKLNKLSFANNVWDFDLAMDIDLSFPDFGNKKLPKISGISFTPNGFVFPKINFDNFSIPNINFGGFSLDLYGFSTPGFTFDLSKWSPGAIAKMAFDWKVKFNMPNLPTGTDEKLKLPNWDLVAKIVDGNFKLKLPDMKFPTGLKIPIPGNLNFDVKSFVGELNTNFNGSLMSFIPDVKIGGTVTLPEALRCKGDDGKIDISKIKLNGDGSISGVIENFVPKCPINIGLASLYMKKSEIEFKKDNGQKILLSGLAGIKFTKNETKKEAGEIEVVYEVINNKLLKAEGEIRDFGWDLPTENPMFSFRVAEAKISNSNLIINSRSQLVLPSGSMAVTFDKLKIDINDSSIKDGRIVFSQPFAMLVNGIDGGGLNFSAVQKGEIPKKKNFVYLELPTQITLDKKGFAVNGKSKAVLNYNGKQLDKLSTKFSNNFAFSLMPFKVTKGMCEIFIDEQRVAYFNRDGFTPDPAYFLNKVVPDKLPLPTLDIAYLQIRKNNKLLVDMVKSGGSTRFTTRKGQPIELVFSALKFQAVTAPKILVNFNIAIDDATGKLTSGFIKATIPTQSAVAFDLSKVGIPYTIHSIYYGNVGGVNQFELDGKFKAFEKEFGDKSLKLKITEAGILEGNVDLKIAKKISLIPNSDKLNLIINKIRGNFNVNLSLADFKFDFKLDSKIDFTVSEKKSFGADVAFQLKHNAFNLTSFTPSGNLKTIALDLGWLKWKFDNLKLKKLAYVNNKWDFDLTMDIDLSFPDFGNKKLPKIAGISFTPNGFVFPKISFDNFSIPNINFGGFSLDLYGLSTPGFTFDLSKWSPGAIAKMAFDLKVKLKMPNLPLGTDEKLKLLNWDLAAKIIDGNFNLKFPEMKFPKGFKIPLPGNLNLDLKMLSGKLNTKFNGSVMSFLPDIKAGGTITLPKALRCKGDDGKIDISKIKLNGDGSISGVIEDFVPKCPINIGLASLYMKKSKLEFTNSGGQKILLSGKAGIKFTKNEIKKEAGEVNVVYEIINNKLLKAEGKIENFKWDLPTENPMFSFHINEATLSGGKITVDSRSQLNLPGNENIGVTFDKFKISLNDYSIKGGRIIFDQPFAMLVDGIGNGGINFSAVKKGEIPKKKNFIYLELPTKISLDKNGFALEGESKAVLNYGGKQLDKLSTMFSKDFAFSLMPFKVTKGKCEIFIEKDKVAYFNRDGFFPDPTYFLNKVVPEKLPLPALDIAYLQIKQNKKLLVDISRKGNSTRFSTRKGEPVELVLPVLQFKAATAPKILVNFNIEINDVTGKVTKGFIKATIPSGSADAFDLSKVGIPYAIHSIYYGNVDGVTQFKLDGKIKAFEKELGNESLSLKITQAGILEGQANLKIAKKISLIPNSDKLNLVVNKVTGNFKADLRKANFKFNLELDSDIRFTMDANKSFGIWTKLGLSNEGVKLLASRIDKIKIPKINLSKLKLGIENLTLGKLSYSDIPNAKGITGWDFEFGMDLDFEFPGMNFKIPKIPNVILNRSGFHTMSKISIPSFPDNYKFQFGGIELKPLAFRMPKLNFNWFDPLGSLSKLGFQFDFEVNFPNLADASGAMKKPRLTILNAGFSDGVITGKVKPVIFDAKDNLNLNFGKTFGFSIRGISGGLINDNGSQGVEFKFKGDFKLPDFMKCKGKSGIVSMGSAELSLNSLGQVSGIVQNFVPKCPVDLGFGKFNITKSSLKFDVNQSKQSAVLDMAGNLVVNTGNNKTVTANGALKLNLLTGEVIDGEIGINQKFVWGIPSDKPVLNFTINSAVLNKDGLKIDGKSSLKLPNSTTQSVVFDKLVFDYRKFRIKSGSIKIDGGFALKLALKNGGLDWGVIPANEKLTEDKTAKIGFTSKLILDASGLSVSGDAIASIRWDKNPKHQFSDVKITYSKDFKISINPFEVSQGQADLIYNKNVIATLGTNGFKLGNIFGVIPMPEIIPLPSKDIAYLRIKKDNKFLVKSERVKEGLRIYTDKNNPVSLFLPALKVGSSKVDEIPTLFSIVINQATGKVVKGEIKLANEDGKPLINLKDRGIPIDILKIHYKNSGKGYSLTADANISIPKILNGLPLELKDIGFNNKGLTGNISAGKYSETYKGNLKTVAKVDIGTEASITLEGLEVVLGNASKFMFSGKLIPKMLTKDKKVTKIQYASSWNTKEKKFTFAFDFKNGKKFDFGIGYFTPLSIGANPAMKLSVMEDNFELLMNGEFKAKSFGDEFALTIKGLKITKKSVSADAISIPKSNPLKFELFNSKFKIFDSPSNSKAIKFSYNKGVLTLALSGELDIFDHTTSFSDFKIGTDGTLSIGNTNFIAGKELAIIKNHLALDQLGIVSKVENKKTEYKLAVGGWVKLPEPVANSKFKFGFNIAPNGTITADKKINNQIIFINEKPGIGGNDKTEFDLWKAKFDLTYLALDLNFSHMKQSSVNMIADIYWDNNKDKRVSIGDKSNSNNIKPGLEIDFTGNVEWKNVSVKGDFEFKSDMLKIGISNVQLSSDANNNLTIGLNGKLGLNIASISGGLTLKEFKFNKTGIVDVGKITEGQLSIKDVGSLKLKEISYSDKSTTINVEPLEKGKKPNKISVNSYLKFGGEITITGLGAGGVDNFLTYTTDNSTTLIIKNAHFEVAGGSVKASMDLFYQNSSKGFLIRAGGMAEIKGSKVVVVGKIQKFNNKVSFGFFLAASVKIPLGPIVITEIGGGFFYNPTADDISTIKKLANVGSKAKGKIEVQGGKFAVFLYGQVTIASDALISGRVLVTITDRQFMLDGKVIILKQKNKIEGGIHLMVQWKPTFAAEGEIVVDVKVASIIKGNGKMGFYVYSKEEWAIYGAVKMELFKFIKASSDFFVGNSGFMLGMKAGFEFDIWIIEIGAGIEVKVWYLPAKSWGAYAQAYIKVGVLGGIVSAEGSLKCALIGANNHTYLYGQAALKVRALFVKWNGSVWAKIDNGNVSGGRGSDSEMDALIAAASSQSKKAEKDMNKMKKSVQSRAASGATFNENDLKNAFSKLTQYGTMYKYGTSAERAKAEKLFNELKEVEEGTFQFKLFLAKVSVAYTPTTSEKDLYNWAIDNIYKARRAPNLTQYNSRRNSIKVAVQEYNKAKSVLLPLLDKTMSTITPVSNKLDQTVSDPTSGKQTVTYYTDQYGNRKIKVHGISLDNSIADKNKSELIKGMASIQEYRKNVYAKYQKINSNIISIESVLRGSGNNSGKGGAEGFSNSYAKLIEKIHYTYLYEYIYYKQVNSWASQLGNILYSKNASIRLIMNNKAKKIYSLGAISNAGYRLLAAINIKRVEEIAKLSGESQAGITAKVNQEATAWKNNSSALSESALKAWAIKRSTSIGEKLWLTIPSLGLSELEKSTKNTANKRLVEKRNNLEKMGNIQAQFTNKMNTLYGSLIGLSESKYDILTKLIRWESEPVLILGKKSNAKKLLFESAKRELEAKMTVPIISGLVAGNTDLGICSFTNIKWSVSGPRSDKYTYMIDFNSKSPDINSQGMQAIGNKKYLQLFYTPKIGQSKFGASNFYLKARNEVGYTIHKNITFTPTFSNTSNLKFGAYTSTKTKKDNTPPIITHVKYPYQGAFFSNGSGSSKNYFVQYTKDSTRISAKWVAYDKESGIQEYRYNLFNTSLPATSSIQAGSNSIPSSIGNYTGAVTPATTMMVDSYLTWTNNFGRDNVVINGLSMKDGDVYQVRVAAKNGDGVWTDNTQSSLFNAGKNIFIEVDLTPPPAPTKASAPGMPTINYGVSSNYIVRGEVALPSGAENSGSQYYSGSLQGVVTSGFVGSLDPTVALGFGGSKSGIGNSSNSFLGTMSVADYKKYVNAFDNDYAEVDINYNVPTDPITGQKFDTEVRISSVHHASVTTNWFKNWTGHFENNNQNVNKVLSYIDSFYVDIRTIDLAKNRSKITRFIVQPRDVTIPSKPIVNFAYSSNKQRAYLVFDTQSSDPQCGIKYYEVGSGTNSNDITFNNSFKIAPSDISSKQTVLLPILAKRDRTIFAVRAVNTQGTEGEICYTGPFYQDSTPPTRPSVTKISSYLDFANQKLLAFEIGNSVDKESEVVSYEYRIFKAASNDGLGRSGSSFARFGEAPATSWISVKSWTPYLSILSNNLNNSSFELLMSKLNIDAGSKIKIEARAINKLDLISTVGSVIYTVPSFTNP